ncbi:membrane protein insertion efficiency factor YidD [Mycolicibacterium tokaiense]|uniref:membrane protein insertion efficiency factor YidD n=1 Tax=Mycolicibacterium tokaiense TaxID=39695 RepID=UPI000E1BFD5E|nr:membrane protein insertion efficiency factor YidD [Mycolicibacterium tokaiense]BBY85901.1 hypothetical protein MTOK_16830 [Mycolicibacterium tokaiense]
MNRRFPTRALIFLIQLYRHTVSPLRLPTCRFTPTCSQYAVDALTEFGLLRGSWLTVVRLAKCGPWHRGGWDPIPDRPDRTPDTDAVSGGRNESYV